MPEWITVGTADQVSEDTPLGVKIGEKHVGVFRVDGKLYAIDDICPHAFALLSQGFVDGQTVECCLHGAVFDLPSGNVLKEPAESGVRTYQVRENDGQVQVLDD